MPDDDVMQKFLKLCSRLSPENLHCDGEISRSEAEQRRKQIMREWHDLEEECGYTMTEDDVWDWHLARIRR